MSGQAMKFFDAPPLRYMGSKWQLADWIIDQFPDHVTYVEPFCGGAGVFFRKGPSPVEVLNDLNGEVINFFDCLRNQTAALIHAIEATPYARAEYEQAWLPAGDPIERARHFYIRSRMAFASETGRKTGWRMQRNDNRASSLTREWKRLEGLHAGAERLKDAQIECGDALTVIGRYDTDNTLFYVDPPYPLDARRRARNRYACELTDADHRDLAESLYRVKGMVILSGYRCDLYDELYPDWTCISKTTTTNGNSSAIESLWISPQADERRHPLYKGQS